MRLELSRLLTVLSRLLTVLCITAIAAGTALGHGVASGDAAFIEQSTGLNIGPWLYLGAKHMVTGYDHLLFLLGVVFLLGKRSFRLGTASR